MGWEGGDKQKKALCEVEPLSGGFYLIAVVLDFAPSFQYL